MYSDCREENNVNEFARPPRQHIHFNRSLAPIYPGSGSVARIDCSGFVTQLLRRLARCNSSGAYPINHLYATAWQTATDKVLPVSWNDIQQGDIVSWDAKPGNTYGHVVIFDHWDESGKANYGIGDWYYSIYSAITTGVQRHHNIVDEYMHPMHWRYDVQHPVFRYPGL